jgi:6-phosphogluconolactonase/glucosamine-6-phosphate isomerase/deaminase
MSAEMIRFPNDHAVGEYIADGICKIVLQKPEALICIAAGTTSFPVFDALNARVADGRLSLKRAAFIGMDEWVGLPMDADGAMADFLRRHFLDRAGFGDVFLFDGAADPQSECARAEAFLAAHGNFDVIVFGIGVNGHVALNEPGADPSLRTHVADVAAVTARVAKKYFTGEEPELKKGVTIGIANALEARKLYVMANSPQKRAVVEQIERMIYENKPSGTVPASFVVALPQTEFCVTDDVFA